jgi:hypothetical protein
MVLSKYKESKTYLYETLEPQWFDNYFDWKKDGRKVSIKALAEVDCGNVKQGFEAFFEIIRGVKGIDRQYVEGVVKNIC